MIGPAGVRIMKNNMRPPFPGSTTGEGQLRFFNCVGGGETYVLGRQGENRVGTTGKDGAAGVEVQLHFGIVVSLLVVPAVIPTAGVKIPEGKAGKFFGQIGGILVSQN